MLCYVNKVENFLAEKHNHNHKQQPTLFSQAHIKTNNNK